MTTPFYGYIPHADVIAGFAFDEESGNLSLGMSAEGKMSFIPRPELEVSQR